MSTMPTVEELKKMQEGTSFYMPLKALISWGTSIFVLMLVLGITLAYFLVNSREETLYTDIHGRMEVMTQDKSELMQTWASNLQNSGAHIASADVIRLFAAEHDLLLQDDTKKLSKSISGQAAYFQVSMDEYVKQNNLASSYIVGKNGNVFLKSSGAAGLTSAHKKYIQRVLETGNTLVSPFSIEDGQILTIVARPIFALDNLNKQPKTLAALVSTFVVTENVLHFLKEGPLNKAGEESHILQNNFGVVEHITFSNNMPTMYSVKGNAIDGLVVGNRQIEEFTYGKSMVGDEDVFAVTSYVHGTPFVVLKEYDKKAALLPLDKHYMAVHGFMLLTIIIISVLVLLMLNYVISTRNRNRVHHQQQVLNALVKSVEIRDPYLSGHHARVARISLEVGNQMRLTIPERSTLYYAAMLSGVGKIFIPRAILAKPGKLTAKETTVLRGHIDHAMEVLGDMDFDLPISTVVEQMYERIDGTGYPNSKKGAEINFLSRILGACDVYCALTKPRSYREAMSVKEALEVMDVEVDKYDKGVMGVLRTVKEG